MYKLNRKENTNIVVGIYFDDDFYPCLDWDKIDIIGNNLKLEFYGDGMDKDDSFGFIPKLSETVRKIETNKMQLSILNINNGFQFTANVRANQVCWGCPGFGPYRPFLDVYINFEIIDGYSAKKLST